MNKQRKAPSRHSRGAAMLESVLTLVVFLAMFIGVFDVGEMMFVHQTLTDRARNAVRWGVVNPYDATGMTNLVLYGATTPSQGQTGSFGLSATNILVSRPAASIGQPEDRVILTITYPVSLISVFLGRSATWSGTSVPTWNLSIQVSSI